jgi:hypothetical protein
MTARNTAASSRPEKLRKRIVRALLGGIIAAGSARLSHTQFKRGQTRDDRELDQRVRECGEW